jgi:hypothetical protein
MNKLLLVACLFLSNIVLANPVTVTGLGRSFEEAKQQAFRKAIEFQLGATVLSDIETQKFTRVKDEIYVYSAGYVDDYKIVKHEVFNQIVSLTASVTVSESKIRNRIISVGKSSSEFDSQRHTSQISTYLQERISGDTLLTKHLQGYPTKAFNIKQFPYKISIDERRNVSLIIPYEISWNFDYVKTLREILTVVQDKDNGPLKNNASGIVIMVKDPKDWLIGSKTIHKFDDLQKVNLLHNHIQGSNEARLVIRLKDMYNNDIYGICYSPMFISGGEAFYSTGEPRVKEIYGNAKEQGEIRLPVNFTILDKTSKIELSIDADFNCRK